MFERFTDRARTVMAMANKEAQRYDHPRIDTGHMLLGLIGEGTGVGAHVLKNLGVDLREIRLEVEKRLESGPEPITASKLPQTSEAKKVIEYAIYEARNLNHNYVGTEHLLLGLLRQEDSVAARVLVALGLELDDVRREVIDLLGEGMKLDDAGRMDMDDEATRRLLDRNRTLSMTVLAVQKLLPIDEPVTPGRMVLALIEHDPTLSKRLAPLMEDIRKACEEP